MTHIPTDNEHVQSDIDQSDISKVTETMWFEQSREQLNLETLNEKVNTLYDF